MAKKNQKLFLVKAKKKTAIAVARIKEGKGRITINKKPLDVIDNKYVREYIKEPLSLLQEYKKDLLSKADIAINVKGGGFMSQATVSRAAIAKAFLAFTGDDNLKDYFFKYDKTLVVDDVRRKEAKKQLGRGARAKWQKSKR